MREGHAVRKPRVVTTKAETVQIWGLLRDHLKEHPTQKGTFAYEDGWSDREVAAHVSARLNAWHVGRTRLSMFGPFPAASAEGDDARFAALEREVEALRSAVRELQSRVIALEPPVVPGVRPDGGAQQLNLT